MMANKINLLSLTDSHFHQITNNCLPWIPIQELNKEASMPCFSPFFFFLCQFSVLIRCVLF